jgi:uncharacterized coiled-coil protein SlyX
MAINYIAALKMIPWDDVVRNAPRIIEGSKKLWNGVAKKSQPAATGIDARLSALETQVAELQQELTSSAELISALADQNSRLIQAVASLQARMRLMVGAVAVLAVGAIASIALLLAR